MSTHHADNHTEHSWADARDLAYSLVELGQIESTPLDSCDRRVCASNLVALTDLPFAETSSMDGWAVNGTGPWTFTDAEQLEGNETSVVTTGAALPLGTQAIVRTENGMLTGNQLTSESASADDIRNAGEECRSGETLCSEGTTLNPALIGLLAATGHDSINVFAQPRIQIIITGNELLTGGLPTRKLVRDSLGPQIPMWLKRMGAEVLPVLYVNDQPDAISQAMTSTDADIVVTTGGTAASAKDHFRTAIANAQGRMLIDGVAVRPGHPMKLAVANSSTTQQTPIVGLPGNPLAAIAALTTLVQPIINKMLGQQLQPFISIRSSASLKGGGSGTRLVPGSVVDAEFIPAEFSGSAMLRGLSTSTGFAIVTLQVEAGNAVLFLPLPG